MDHPALRATINALLEAISLHPLCLLNEGFLEVVAAEAAIKEGAWLIEGSNKPGKQNRWTMNGGEIATSAIHNSDSLLGLNDEQGRPKGTNNADLRLRLPLDDSPNAPIKFDIELKAICDSGSTSNNSSGRLLEDFSSLVEGKAQAFCIASDKKPYDDLRNSTAKTGRSRDFHVQNFFNCVFPVIGINFDNPLRHKYTLRKNTGYGPPPGDLEVALRQREFVDIHSRIHVVESAFGKRILSVFSCTEPDWANGLGENI